MALIFSAPTQRPNYAETSALEKAYLKILESQLTERKEIFEKILSATSRYEDQEARDAILTPYATEILQREKEKNELEKYLAWLYLGRRIAKEE